MKYVKAIFLNSKSLQPMPTPDAYPNISGNANSTSKTLPGNIPSQNTQTEQNNILNTSSNNTNQSMYISYAVLVIIIFLIIWGIKKLRKKVNTELEK